MFDLGGFLNHVMGNAQGTAQTFTKNLGHNVTHPVDFMNALTGGVIGNGAPTHPYMRPAAVTPLMDTKANPIGQPQLNQHYNAAVMNHNQTAINHLNPLPVVHPAQWQQGALQVRPVANGGGSYVNPFDTDTQTLNPMNFGTHLNYQGGQMHNPQLYNQMYRGL